MVRGIFGVMLILFLLAGQGLAWAEKVRFGTPVKANPTYDLPMITAEEKGLFKQAGVELEWIPFSAGAALNQAVAAGSVDMGMAAALLLLLGISRGVPYVLVGDLNVPYNFYLYVRADSRIKEPADLKGARIDIVRFGGAAHAYGRLVVERLGLEKEVKFTASGGARENIAALKAGRVGAIVTQLLSILPLKATGEVREIVSVKDYLPREQVEVALFGHKSFTKERGQGIRETIKAIFQATEYITAHRDWAIGRMKAAFGYSDQAAGMVAQELRFSKGQAIERKGLENVASFLVNYGLVAKDKISPLEGLYDNRFIP